MQIQKWQIAKAGSIKRLRKITDDIEDPNPNEVQVAIKAIGLNFADIFACQGLYSATPKGKFTPGLEFSGIVTKIGKQVRVYKMGDSVMGVTRFGGYTTHINIADPYIRHLPEDWTYEQGAALIVQGLTAWYGLMELGNLKRDQQVLVQSAAGGVGLQAIDIIKKKNAIPVAVVGNIEKSNFLQEFCSLKPEQIIIRDQKNFLYQISETLKHLDMDGFHIIMDAVFGAYFKPGYQNLLPMGRYVLFGAANMMNKKSKPDILTILYNYLNRPKLDPLAMISENKGLLAFNLIWLFDEIETLSRTLSNFIDSNPRKPFIDRVFDFNSVFDAIRHLQSGHSMGKVILKVG